MTPTILFDLDDTLLANSMDTFLPAYFKLLSDHLQDYYPPQQLPPLIYRSTEKMVQNLDPEISMEHCFDSVFYPELNQKKSDLSIKIFDFYQNKFPELKPLTQPFPTVPKLIKSLEKNKFNIGISTNPLFPKKAIEHRLAWAGIPVGEHSFNTVTTFEDYHFCKPHPDYYAETIAQMGWPDGPVLMVGNDWKMDILPAEELGIPTYYVGSSEKIDQSLRHHLSENGSINEIETWIYKVIANNGVFECRDSLKAYLAILRSTPAAINTLIKSIDQDSFYAHPIKSEWSLIEILSHLRDVDDKVNLPRVKMLKTEKEPFFSAQLTDEWAKDGHYLNNNITNTLNQYNASRKTLINNILELTDQDWRKTITHTIFGPTSPLEIIKFMAQHDRLHVQQIYKTTKSL